MSRKLSIKVASWSFGFVLVMQSDQAAVNSEWLILVIEICHRINVSLKLIGFVKAYRFRGCY